jgi:hypothetical protein
VDIFFRERIAEATVEIVEIKSGVMELEDLVRHANLSKGK